VPLLETALQIIELRYWRPGLEWLLPGLDAFALRQGRLRSCLLEFAVCPRAEGKKMPGRPWTENETKRARDMYAAGHFYGEIDWALGRRAGSTKRRLEGLGRSVRSSRIPDNLLAERDARVAAREQRSLTQDFCGDPPPGYSALHGKTGLR